MASNTGVLCILGSVAAGIRPRLNGSSWTRRRPDKQGENNMQIVPPLCYGRLKGEGTELWGSRGLGALARARLVDWVGAEGRLAQVVHSRVLLGNGAFISWDHVYHRAKLLFKVLHDHGH
ncbi:hypothetical protein N656DRAFT_464780 [Canariomyces notabilis]|uniref:Uncharacterized protein n=1 Tax=Canariomyces notabilis TaxID=2074819 RepID=A0AAN6QCR1_9PEZI|nr:hypothetical protein N656DRAFT_464780 [Canariomyces arenarius]